jgi:Trypsin-like peptidase domain
MERKQAIVERAREIFGNRLDEVLHSVEQDRQDLRGWQEPAHLRAALRRAVREEGAQPGETTAMLAEAEIGRAAGEPDKGQQREALGQILEAGGAALEKMRGNRSMDLSTEELLGLECVVLLYARPGLLISRNRLADGPAFWNVLQDQRDDIELSQRGVGRIELVGHPEFDWAGTGFLVGESCLMTTRSVAQMFAESANSAWQFRPGISAWMDYRGERQQPSSAAHRVKGIMGIHDRYDLAMLEVERPQQNGAPAPLPLATEAPPDLVGRPVYLIGYPVRDGRRNEPEEIARIFRDHYDVKRVQPGTLRGLLTFRDVHILQHDCAPLGHSAGGCLVDVETHRVLGLHVSGRYLENGMAIPMWSLKDDPLMQRCGVTYTQARPEEMQAASDQMERLARSRLWEETRKTIASLYERAFGKES